jgi:hypothetical protein
MRRILRRLLAFVVLDLLLVLSILVSAAVLKRRFATELAAWVPWADVLVPLAALLLCLPIIVHAVGKEQVLTMALSEIGVRPDRVLGRALLRGLLFALLLLPLLLIVLGFAAAMLGSWQLAALLLGVLLVIAAAQWRRLADLYARAQGDIEATLAERPAEPETS